MVHFSPAKINIGLNITGKRPDGYHNLQTIFYPLPFYDAVDCVISPQQTEPFHLTLTGLEIPGSPEQNLCSKAYHLLKNSHPDIPPLNVHLHKAIPGGGGLGGGSSNAAAMLHLINDVAQLHISIEKLFAYALQLGSDCPFFIDPNPALATGRGEVLSPIQINLNHYNILLVYAGISVSTAWAFAELKNYTSPDPYEEWITLPPEEWPGKFTNHFEPPVFAAHPELAAVKEQLIQSGAVYASLSGTGGTVYGIFPKNVQPELSFPPHYFLKWC